MKPTTPLALRCALTLLALAALPAAQTAKLDSKYFGDPFNGYKFRYPDGWLVVPIQEPEREFGLQARISGFEESTKLEAENVVRGIRPELCVIEIEDEVDAPMTGRAVTEATKSAPVERKRPDLGPFLRASLRDLEDFDADQPAKDESETINKLPVRHRIWRAHNASYEVTVDTWTFRLADRDVALVFLLPAQHEKKWLGVFKRCAKTFELFAKEEGLLLGRDASYAELLAYHEEDASRTPGWRVLPTPGKQFVVKTSSENQRFIDDVIAHLEASRRLFEADFPPPRPIEHVSVVRICSSEDEFHAYGHTKKGVAGWFNPKTTELVLFDTVEDDRNATYAVMTHEAFHQYCHFLFDQSEAHRWFDEGHGDYYGGARFEGGRVKITPRMPGDLERLGGAKALVQGGTYAPLAQHLYADHEEWRNQGPTPVASYEQSWSIVYMLRRGARGEVPAKIWKPAYAEIIPSYVRTLHAGFLEAYDEIRRERAAKAERQGRELTEAELHVDCFDLEDERRAAIWERAMEASWGQVDLQQFERDWIAYVDRYL